MMQSAGSTIFALATASGRGAIAIMRLSGPHCGMILDTLCRDNMPAPRHAVLRSLWLKEELLDRALVLWFPGPHSYTGEDCAELHLHAGAAVIDAVADALGVLGARPAEAGEFTRRAFHHGRMDLLEAEGIADLVEAETQAQRRQALQQAEGALSRLYDDWAGRLRMVLAQQEALIDFPDEELPTDAEARLVLEQSTLVAEMQGHLAAGGPGERLRRGLVFAIIGAPNVGKSSLVNALAERDVAIVSAQAGTTRDAIEVRVVLGDVPVTLVDTAGLRDTQDVIEAEGVRRARRHAEQADLVIHVVDPWTTPWPDETSALVVCNKADQATPRANVIAVSATTGSGLAELSRILSQQAERMTSRSGPAPLTRARHRAGISDALLHLEQAQATAWPELRGEELRLAMRALGRLTGTIGVEDLLDTVFRQFCIGK